MIFKIKNRAFFKLSNILFVISTFLTIILANVRISYLSIKSSSACYILVILYSLRDGFFFFCIKISDFFICTRFIWNTSLIDSSFAGVSTVFQTEKPKITKPNSALRWYHGEKNPWKHVFFPYISIGSHVLIARHCLEKDIYIRRDIVLRLEDKLNCSVFRRLGNFVDPLWSEIQTYTGLWIRFPAGSLIMPYLHRIKRQQK